MRIYAIFGQRNCTYEDEYAPELLEAWDEWTVEENPQDWDEKLDKWLSEQGPGHAFSKVEVFHIEIDEETLYKALNTSPELGALIKKAPAS